MPAVKKNPLQFGDQYRRQLRELAALLANVRAEIARVEGICVGCKDDTIEEGRQHRLKCLSGHQRALKDASEAILHTREQLSKLGLAYLK